MIAYHIDRSNKLHPGQEISLFKYPDSNDSFSFMAEKFFNRDISQHGFQYLSDVGIDDNHPLFVESGIEMELEFVRRAFFPENISRFQSFYALESLDDLIAWEILWKNQKVHLWEIEFLHSHYEKHDANLMPHFHNFQRTYSPSLDFQWAYKYWSGESSENPMCELLIQPPVFIKQEIHLPTLTP